MCISTNYSRKGKRPEGPEIACVLLFCILKGRANLEEIGSHFIQSQPKWHVSLPRAAVRLCGCRQSPCLPLCAEKVWLAEPEIGCPTLGGCFQPPGGKVGARGPPAIHQLAARPLVGSCWVPLIKISLPMPWSCALTRKPGTRITEGFSLRRKAFHLLMVQFFSCSIRKELILSCFCFQSSLFSYFFSCPL